MFVTWDLAVFHQSDTRFMLAETIAAWVTFTITNARCPNYVRLGCVTYVDLHERAYHVTLAYASTDGVCDVVTAVILCWLLHTSRSSHHR
jgi:hypothetical protein